MNRRSMVSFDEDPRPLEEEGPTRKDKPKGARRRAGTDALAGAGPAGDALARARCLAAAPRAAIGGPEAGGGRGTYPK